MSSTYNNAGPIYLTQAQYDALETKEVGREYCIIGGLDAADIPSLDASKITSGTFTDDKIPDLDASKIASGTFADARIASASTWNSKQDAITSSAKLSADLVDDSSATNKFVTDSDKTTWNGKQDQLVSGTNIKTINNESLLGSGNIQVSLEWEHVTPAWDTNPGTLAQAQSEGYTVEVHA